MLGDEWRGPDCTRLRYRYTALPEGLLPRFITRTYPLSEDRKIRWVNGVVLDSDGARALVKADPAERLVTVTVTSDAKHRDARRGLVGTIRTHLRRIHDDINRLDPIEEIELKDLAGVYLPLETLEADERKRKQSFVPTKSGTIEVQHTTELNRVSAPAARDPDQWKAKLFISYSSKDARQHDQLNVRLTPMQNEGLVETWSARCLVAGQPWDQIIRQELKEADVVLFLVSATFLATDYIRDVELKHALERAVKNEAVVVSVILEECAWKEFKVTVEGKEHRLGDFQVLPAKANPVRDAKPNRKAWHAVAEGLRKVVESLQAKHKEPLSRDRYRR